MEHGYKWRSMGRALGFLLLFISFFMGTGYTQTITIGSGTATSSNLPIVTYYGYTYSQQLYTQAQIATAGSISKIRFYYSSGGTTNSSAWKILMGHTTKTTFSTTTDWVPLASMTEVFNGSVTFPAAGSWMEITLSTPFVYNNTDNLVIAVDENTPSYAASNGFWRVFTSGSNTGIYFRSDSNNPDPAAPPTATGRSSDINQLQLVFATPQLFTSATTEQGATTPVLVGGENQEIIRLKVETSGSTSPVNLQSITFTTSGTTSISDLTSAVCYYTTSTTFSTSEAFGAVVMNPDGDITFSGSKALADGANYFWLAYNISGTAESGNEVDATCTQFETSETELVRYPTVTDPAGSRTITSPLSGIVTVGTGGTYTSLTGAGGLFEAINLVGLNGNLTANIISDLTENGTNGLNEWVETPASSNFTLLIQSSAATERLIAGTVGDAMIRMNGSDRVTVDGRVGGSGKYLRFRNSNTANHVLSFLNGATLNTFRSCYFEGANTSTGVVLFSTGNNRANTILDSEIKNISPSERPAYGVYFNATSDSSNTIMNCKIYDFTAYGVYISAGTGTIVDSCEIYMTTASTASSVYGIYFSSISATIPTYIVKNRIYGLGGSATSTVKGIYTPGSSLISTIARIENNTIKLEPVTTGTVDGIDYYGFAANSMYIYYNTIYIGGATTGGDSYGIRKRDATTNFTVINNSIQNSRTNSSGIASHYAIYLSNVVSPTLALDNNCYFTDGVGGKLGYWSTTVCTTLAAWQTASGREANSLNSNPLLSTSTNLQPFTGSPLVGAGLPIVNITTDIVNATRSETATTIGAFENTVVAPGVDWCNLQHPGTHTRLEGVVGPNVYAQVYEPGVTEPAGQGAGIQCWIGYSTDNTNPNTWTNWIAATFHGQSGNNDEYKVTLPATLPAGTYYYASRFLLTGGMYQYGGFSGGFWDGTANVSGVLTVNDNSIWWANLQFPATASITEGGSATIYGRAYVIDVTVSPDTSAAITAWVGLNTANTDPSTWAEGSWKRAYFNSHAGNNDEYSASIGGDKTPGTYYYATRYKLLNDSYVYGGYSADGGNFWDGITNVNGTLTVGELTLTPPFIQQFGTFPPTRWTRWNGLLADPSILSTTTSGWVSDNWRNMFTPVNPSARINIYGTSVKNWLVTPMIDLGSGTNYELIFNLALTAYDEEIAPELTGTDDKFAVIISTDNGTTWTSANALRIWDNAGSPNVYNNIAFAGETVTIPLTGYSGIIKVGFYGETTVSNADNDLFIDNVQVRAIPTVSNSSTIQGGVVTPVAFGTTGTTIQFTVANGGDLNLTVDKIGSNPGGTPPGSLQNIAPQYWSITVTSGTVNGTYSITLDITGVPGVTNPATLHLLKRDNASGAWTDLGVANSISGNLLTWTGLTSFSEFGIGSNNDNPLPVQLSTFSVTTESRNALLSWETATEENAFKFVVEKKNIDAATWSVAGEVKANGNSNSPKKYNYTDQKLNSGKYNYRLKMIDNDGTFTYSDVVEVDISVPKDYAVSQNYPNPFNPTTKIDYQLPFDSRVQIELYNITGERVATLLNMDQKAGYYTFDFTNTSHLSSGVYIYRIIATGAAQDKPFTAVKKMVMMK